MSYSLPRTTKGMTYGEMPYEDFLTKMEATDIIDENTYNDYMRNELSDRSFDTPFLESDAPKKNNISNSVLNLRYNGRRGTSNNPQHPDLFIGELGNDPRGITNNPRMSDYRNFINTHSSNLQVSMGNNEDRQIDDRPWMAQSIGHARKEIHKRQKDNLKIFSHQKDGKINKNKFVANIEAKKHTVNSESLNYLQFKNNVYGLHSENFLKNKQPWKNSVSTLNLSVQKYTQNKKSSKINNDMSGGIIKNSIQNELEEYILTNKNNKQQSVFDIVSLLHKIKTEQLNENYHENTNRTSKMDYINNMIKQIEEDQLRNQETSENINMKHKVLLKNMVVRDSIAEDQTRIQSENENVNSKHSKLKKMMSQNIITEEQFREYIIQDQNIKKGKSSQMINDTLLRNIIEQSSDPNILSNIELIVRHLGQKFNQKSTQLNTTHNSYDIDTKETQNRRIGQKGKDNNFRNVKSNIMDTMELSVHNYQSKKLENTSKSNHNSKDSNNWAIQSNNFVLNHTNVNPKWKSHSNDEVTTNNRFGLDSANLNNGHGPVGPKLLRPDKNTTNISEFF